MAMEISSNYKDYAMQTNQEKVKEVLKEQGKDKENENIPIPKDEYIHSEKSGNKPSGLYNLGQDESGNPQIFYDDPKKAAKKESAKKVTGNTDNVDREIKRLKEEKKSLEQQIRALAGDEERVEEIKKKLSKIEEELRQKDNDTYRRRNSVVDSCGQ